jgi:hypothetical protein
MAQLSVIATGRNVPGGDVDAELEDALLVDSARGALEAGFQLGEGLAFDRTRPGPRRGVPLEHGDLLLDAGYCQVTHICECRQLRRQFFNLGETAGAGLQTTISQLSESL